MTQVIPTAQRLRIRSSAVLLLGTMAALAGCRSDSESTPTETKRNSGVITSTDYDWIPEQLRHTMDHLTHLHPNRHFKFLYYFATEDVNRNFYMTDPGLDIIAKMPVTNENALRRIEDDLYNVTARERGIVTTYDTTNVRGRISFGKHSPYFEPLIAYVLPEDSADFCQLRVAVVEDPRPYSHERYERPADLKIYSSSEVDTPAQPVQGMDYFREVVMEEVQKAEVFALYDTGTVEVSFVVWGHRAHSPNLIQGFSSKKPHSRSVPGRWGIY